MENNIDFQVDETLEKCILSTPRKSFFLFAGAGSGKTYSLVLLLKKIRNSIGKELLLQGKNVAVITFTNAATDEIINRLDYSSIFQRFIVLSGMLSNTIKQILRGYIANILSKT